MMSQRVRAPPRHAIAPARRCAYAVLRRVFERGAYADQALQRRGRASSIARDRALAMRLAYGAVQRKGTLDHLIERLAERPAARLDPPVLAALRLGLYELLYLRGAPDYAVVGRRRRARQGRTAAAATASSTPCCAGPRARAASAARRAHRRHARAGRRQALPPEWIARLWWEELGADDARALMACDNEPGELALRANTLVTDAADARRAQLPVRDATATRAIPEALVLDGPFDVHGSPLWRAGAFIAQSRAAMLVARALAPAARASACSTCAPRPAARARTWRR